MLSVYGRTGQWTQSWYLSLVLHWTEPALTLIRYKRGTLPRWHAQLTVPAAALGPTHGAR
jgi:hypothetical protein